jgi:hypothetical protein
VCKSAASRCGGVDGGPAMTTDQHVGALESRRRPRSIEVLGIDAEDTDTDRALRIAIPPETNRPPNA